MATATDTTTETITERIQRWKAKAEIFHKEKRAAFIENYDHDYFFCTIVAFSDTSMKVEHFKGKRKSSTDRINYVDILRFKDYEEKTPTELNGVESRDARHCQKVQGSGTERGGRR